MYIITFLCYLNILCRIYPGLNILLKKLNKYIINHYQSQTQPIYDHDVKILRISLVSSHFLQQSYLINHLSYQTFCCMHRFPGETLILRCTKGCMKIFHNKQVEDNSLEEEWEIDFLLHQSFKPVILIEGYGYFYLYG